MTACETLWARQIGIPVELRAVKWSWCDRARLVRAAGPESGRVETDVDAIADAVAGILVGQGEWLSPIG